MLRLPVVIHEDKEIIVLDKPYGLTVNRSETTRGEITLQDWIESKCKVQSAKCKVDREEDFYKRSGIVHRLDKDTSGLILVAKTPEAFFTLQKQFKERIVKKTYFALVWGVLEGDGEIKAPITRNPFNRSKFGVFVGGKEAWTRYHALENKEISGHEVTLVEVYLETGRTHQIRVHLSYIGHPVVGDPLYSGRKLGREGIKLFGRLMLHAYKISFQDPKTGVKREYISKFPKEFASLMSKDLRVEWR